MKQNIAILAGGNSGEYEVSLKTGQNICNRLDKNLFEPYFIHIHGLTWEYINDKNERFPVDKNDFSVSVNNQKITFAAAFIAIHGNPGEDGKMQGYFEMLKIPYTGCDLFCSALTFNKYFCNLAVAHLGVPISPSLHFYKGDVIDYQQIADVCGFPCFVKPCNSGSSVGVTKVHEKRDLRRAIDTAFDTDSQVMIEQMIHGNEVTCGVARINGKATALAVTEITSQNEFYDFESKYADNLHDMITPAPIAESAIADVMRYSETIYQKLGCKGVVRIDYIVTEENKPIFLEINTIPGQTALSIIPHQVGYLGLDLTDIYTNIINEALSTSK